VRETRFFQKISGLAGRILQSGLTPEKLSLTILLGATVGVMPLLWGTTLLCAVLAPLLRLNMAALQAVNYLCYPLQIALFIPFCRAGELLFPWGPRVSAACLTDALHGHVASTFQLIAWATVRGLGVWLISAPPTFLLLYPLVKALLKKRERERQCPRQE
jgi:uncharacterized protein (DUF2062 family)